MAKDPAFLFYYQDFLVGTEFMTNEEVGVYIRILCHMADKGSLSEKLLLSICRGYAFTEVLQSKFLRDEQDNFYNKRLLEETEKRRKFAESRRNNAKSVKAYAKHMENENINENINEDIKDIDSEIQKIWIKTWGRNPKIPEYEETVELIKKFGIEKVEKIFKKAVLNGFNKLQTLINSLDEQGNIKPKDETPKETILTLKTK